jgi:hypothetical protein
VKVTREMLARQSRLIGRSARVLAREPSLGRELPRLVATRGRSTMALGLPWLPFRLVDELAARVGPGSRVFEYGGGGSTLWFLGRGATVVTVEHHPEWAAELRRRITSDRWTLLERSADDAFADYVRAIEEYPDGSLDVVVVDGRERARCAAAAAAKVAPGGLLLVDDIDRERYHAAVAAIAADGWERRDVVGFAPAKPSLAYTAVLTRPGP